MMEIKLNQILWKKTPRKRRAGAEVIASVLLVAITVVGAVILTTFLDETLLASGTTGESQETAIKTVRLLAYDGRDSVSLMNIQDLNNDFNNWVNGTTAATNDPNDPPVDGGSEFVVMQIQNQASKSIFIKNLNLNGVDHPWDSTTAGIAVDATTGQTGFPVDGTFSILPAEPDNLLITSGNAIQNDSTEVDSGATVNIIVKLGTDDIDYDLDQSIRVLMNIGAPSPVDFIIQAGGAQ